MFMGDILDYCVYIHSRADDNAIFYVGKGRKNRAWSKHNRNKYWLNIVAKFGLVIEIVDSSLSEIAAFNKEHELIKAINPQTNFTGGGEGGDTFSKLSKEDQARLIQEAKIRAKDPNGGIAKAASMRRGKNKTNDAGLLSMAEKHAINFSGSGNPMFGKSHWRNKSEEEKLLLKERVSKSLKETYKVCPRKYEIVTCPHCNKSGGKPGMTRYHFDNCGVADVN